MNEQAQPKQRGRNIRGKRQIRQPRVWKLFKKKPNAWIQDKLCTNAGWKKVEPAEKQACYFCVLGAIHHIYRTDTLVDDAMAKLEEEVGDIVAWNDSQDRTVNDIIKVCKELDI